MFLLEKAIKKAFGAKLGWGLVTIGLSVAWFFAGQERMFADYVPLILAIILSLGFLGVWAYFKLFFSPIIQFIITAALCALAAVAGQEWLFGDLWYFYGMLAGVILIGVFIVVVIVQNANWLSKAAKPTVMTAPDEIKSDRSYFKTSLSPAKLTYTGGYTFAASGIQLAEEADSDEGLIAAEQEVRTYECTRLRFPKCIGLLTVTNRRIIFHGVDRRRRSRIVNEIKLDGVNGLHSFYGHRLSLWRLILGVLALLVGIAFFKLDWGFFRSLTIVGGIIFLLIGVFFLWKCYVRVFFLKIFAAQTSSPIEIGQGYGSLGGNNALFSMRAAPTAQTDAMMLELGAMVSDLQVKGDEAIAKWRHK